MNVFLGYFFSLLNYLIYCGSRFCKSKSQMLACDLLSKVVFVLSLFFFGSISGATSLICNFFYLIVAYFKEQKGARWPVAYGVFQALLIAIPVFRFEGVSSVLVFLSQTVNLFSIWWLRPQEMRAAGIPVNLMTLGYQLCIGNWSGLLELVVIASNLTSWLKYRRQEKEEPQEKRVP